MRIAVPDARKAVSSVGIYSFVVARAHRSAWVIFRRSHVPLYVFSPRVIKSRKQNSTKVGGMEWRFSRAEFSGKDVPDSGTGPAR